MAFIGSGAVVASVIRRMARRPSGCCAGMGGA
ncbi:Uncharacterised protein [Mycobacteroides abscessus subsp. abscessus]|nr:Uncharacterised protein [Mycobacteroides abscessus subsp. abscessus]